MRALVGGLGFMRVLPGSAVLTWGRWFCGRSWWRPGQAAMTWGPWRRVIGAGIPSAASGPGASIV